MQIARQLYRDITTSGSWVRLRRLDTGNDYFTPGVPPSNVMRSDIRWMRFSNFSSAGAAVEFALSAGSSPLPGEIVMPPIQILPGAMMLDTMMHTLPPSYGVLVRVTGGSPNVTVHANILEIT